MSKLKVKRQKQDVKIDIQDVLEAPLHIKLDGKSRPVHAYEAALRKHLHKGIVERSMQSLKFIFGEAEKHDVIKMPDPPLKGGVFTVPKWVPEKLQKQIFDYQVDHRKRDPMSRIWNIIRGFINECKRRAKENAKSTTKE